MTVMPRATFEKVEHNVAQWSDLALTTVLALAGMALIVLAFWPGHRLLKAFVTAYVYLP